jgi:predicted cupin superfamily sugar epimerase
MDADMSEAEKWIEVLQLRPHPEGGYYRRTYQASEDIRQDQLPPRFSGDRPFSTAIYFLLHGEDCSVLHRIKQDEVWHHYAGSCLIIHVLTAGGRYSAIRLGKQVSQGELPQAVVAAGDFFGAQVGEPNSYALVGCTVAPGFDFADLEMPDRDELLRRYPQHRRVIERLTR